MQLPKVRHAVALLATAFGLCCVLTTGPAGAQERSFQIYGFAMLDWIQDTKRMNPQWEDAFRPSRIATPEGQYGTNGQSSLSVKQSRFGMKGSLPTGDNTPPVTFKFEFDFFGTGADAGQTTIRLRHIYGEWGQLLAGQTNSVFMDIDVFPNVIDYWGPAGMVFLRDPQIRWTALRDGKQEVAIAIERPGNDIDPGNVRLIDGLGDAVVNPDETIPDFTAHYRRDEDWGHAQLAGILRRVGYEYAASPAAPLHKGSQTGWGLNLSGVYNTFGKDKVLASLVYGHGIASYMNDGGTDVGPTVDFPATVTSLRADAVPLTGVMAYYDHYWNDQFSTSLGYSYTQVSNTNFQATNAFHKGQYASVNLLWYPAKRVMIGGELLWGKRTDHDGTTGTDGRFQFSVKYDFDAKIL